MVAVPVTGVFGTGAYIYYRVHTRPLGHSDAPLLSDDGALLLDGVVVLRPSRARVFVRMLELLWLFLPLLVRYLFAWTDTQYERWLERALATVERAGPTFVKLGQWACTRNDLFSPAARGVFRRLFSEVDIVEFDVARTVIEAELGAPLETIFSRIDPVPLGSGSIGQVHDAVLAESGRRVAVKVMHPGVVEQVVLDFRVFMAWAHLLHWLMPSMREWELPKQMHVWMNHIAGQLDFRVEASHLNLFRRNFVGVDYVDFPEPLHATQRVLIESFAPGEQATTELLRTLPPRTQDILAGKGLNAYCKMLLRDNFMHGDLHPGNILVDVRDSRRPRVTLIDVGLCLKLNDEQAKTARNLMSSFVRWKADKCTETLLAMGPHGRLQPLADEDGFLEGVRDCFARFRGTPGKATGAIEKVLQELFEVIRVHHVALAPVYANLMFSVLVLEAFIMALNPEYDIVRQTGPWLVSEGYVTKKMLRNVAIAGKQRLESRALDWLSWYQGHSTGPRDDEFQVTQHREFKVRQAS